MLKLNLIPDFCLLLKENTNSKRKKRRETEPTRKRKEIDYKDKILF
jgi:hypothetical protein